MANHVLQRIWPINGFISLGVLLQKYRKSSRPLGKYTQWTELLLPTLLRRLMFPPMAGLFRKLYYERRHMKYLQAGITLGIHVLAATPDEHPSLPHYQQRLAVAYRERFELLGDLKDLEVAIWLQKAAVKAVSQNPLAGEWHYQELDISVRSRYHRLGRIADLEFLVDLEESIINGTPPRFQESPWWIHSLALTYLLRAARLDQVKDIEAALGLMQAAVSATPPGEKVMADRRHTLGACYTDLYARTKNAEDLDAALKWTHAAVDATPAGSHDLPLRKQSLALAFASRFFLSGRLEDIDTAIRLCEESVHLMPKGHPMLPQCWHNISVYYRRRYSKLGRLEDFESSLKWGKAAAATAPPGHHQFAVFGQSLVHLMQARYQRSGSLEDLESAIQWLESAIAAYPTHDGRLAELQRHLAWTYRDRHQKLGTAEDLEAALMWAQLSVATHSSADPTACLHTLGIIHRTRFLRYREVGDVQAAIKNKQAAIAATPLGHNDLHIYLASLALSMADRYEKLWDRADREATMRYIKAAVKATPPGHDRLPYYQENLAMQYSNQYNRLRELDDLQEAIKWGRAAVEATPPGDPHLAGRQKVLAIAYSQRSTLLHDPEDQQQALFYFRKSAKESLNIAPSDLWETAKRWAEFAEHWKLLECLDAYSMALEILPEMMWLGTTITTRHETLVRYDVGTTTTQGVTACVKYNNNELAVEMLEQSLGITFQQLLDLRTDYTSLHAVHPELANTLKEVSSSLRANTVVGDGEKSDKALSLAPRTNDVQRKLAIDRDKIIKEVRMLKGFENFLLPTPYEKLRWASSEGPVVMLNCSASSCDALILVNPNAPVLHVKIARAYQKLAAMQVEKLRLALRQHGIQSRDGDATRFGRPMKVLKKNDDADLLQQVLSWLWEQVVSPVFKVLKDNGITSGRLWWCPTGAFTYLPLHAAGPPNNFIQSYTSTLGALYRAREQHSRRSEVSITAIGLSELSRLSVPHLPSVLTELQKITSVAGEDRVVVTTNANATLDNVYPQLLTSTWLHLACHGHQDPKEPLKSGLLLYDEKLELSKIMSNPLPDAEFVFLSACETAMGDSNMSNESLHLAGGMLFAGFKAAIGTMWSIADNDGPQVAETVYGHLFADGKRPDVKMTAEALDTAVRQLRSRGVPPHRWVPFIHIGV